MEELNFKSVLKDLMQDSQINITTLALKTKLSQGQICLYLKGIILPSAKSLVKLSDYFNCSIDFLLDRTDNKTRNPKSLNNETFKGRLDNLLKENKITAYKLSKDCEFSKSLYYDWRKGSLPAAQQLLTIANYFDISADYLLGLTDIKSVIK